ncbi:Hypothetical protein D9617_13g098910 [Elsinoe fawcettii]|nr:Hypothetical protein D9617_13g098910 [Elsinoe fawcettii]
MNFLPSISHTRKYKNLPFPHLSHSLPQQPQYENHHHPLHFSVLVVLASASIPLDRKGASPLMTRDTEWAKDAIERSAMAGVSTYENPSDRNRRPVDDNERIAAFYAGTLKARGVEDSEMQVDGTLEEKLKNGYAGFDDEGARPRRRSTSLVGGGAAL